jgi:hypothetical protein
MIIGEQLISRQEHRPFPRVTVWQGGWIIAQRRLPWPVSPARVSRVPWNLFTQVDPDAGDVVIGLSSR